VRHDLLFARLLGHAYVVYQALDQTLQFLRRILAKGRRSIGGVSWRHAKAIARMRELMANPDESVVVKETVVGPHQCAVSARKVPRVVVPVSIQLVIAHVGEALILPPGVSGEPCGNAGEPKLAFAIQLVPARQR